MNPRVESFEEQIARLTAERDAWERSARDIAAGSDARGATIWRLQNRLARWFRRFRRADVALRQWKPEAQAWQARCADETTRANLAEEVARRERDRADTLLRELKRAESDVTLFRGERDHAQFNAEQAAIRAEHLADRLRALGQDPDA